MIRWVCLLLLAMPITAAESKPVDLTFEDQFKIKQELKSHRGSVIVLVYGDRGGVDECRKLGEDLHLAFHPTARGLTPAKARLEPTIELPNLPAGKKSPDVVIQAVACCGKMPSAIRPILRTQLAKASPDLPLWLDFEETMKTKFGIKSGGANVVVFDSEGLYRHNVLGSPDEKKLKELLQVIQNLRAASVK